MNHVSTYEVIQLMIQHKVADVQMCRMSPLNSAELHHVACKGLEQLRSTGDPMVLGASPLCNCSY